MADGPWNADYRSHGAYVPLGMLGAAGLILIALATLGALLGAGAPRSDGLTEGGLPDNLHRVWRVARFTFWQASLSAFLSLLVALPVAMAFWRRTLAWRLKHLNSLSFLTIICRQLWLFQGFLASGVRMVPSFLLRAIGGDGLSPIWSRRSFACACSMRR